MAQRNIQQIVKVLIGDTTVLQPGRKKRGAPDQRKAKKAKKAKKPAEQKQGKARPSLGKYVPRQKDEKAPKGQEGFLSQVFGPPKPPVGYPAPFISPTPSFYDRQRQIEEDRLLAKVLQRFEKQEQKETPGKPTPGLAGLSPSSSVASSQSVFGNAPLAARPALSRAPTVQMQSIEDVLPPASQGVFGLPRTGFSIPASASNVLLPRPSISSSVATPMHAASAASSIVPSVPSVSLSQASSLASRTAELIAESQQSIEKAQSLRRTLSQGSQPAPNASVQPSVDVNGDGKEAEELQPQQPAMTFIQASSSITPYSQASSSSAAASSEVFQEEEEEAGVVSGGEEEFVSLVEIDMDDIDEVKAEIKKAKRELKSIAVQVQEAAQAVGGAPTERQLQKDYKRQSQYLDKLLAQKIKLETEAYKREQELAEAARQAAEDAKPSRGVQYLPPEQMPAAKSKRSARKPKKGSED